MDTRDIYKLVRQFEEEKNDVINLYDSMDIELNEGFVIETGVVGFTEDGVIVHLDEDAMEFLDFNGVLLESEELNETHYSEDSPVYNAVLNRITSQHLDLLSKYGPAAVMAAIEDVVYGVGDVDEIGSSDVSIWTKQAIEDLEAGHYKHLHETDGAVDVDSELAEIVKSDDPFELVYRYISGDGGEEMRKALQAMYDDIVIDSAGRLHPDDDFEPIISHIVDRLESDYGVAEGAYSDHWDSKYDDDSTDPSVTPRDKERAAGRRRAEDDGWDPKRDEIDEELSAIKRLAGHEEVDEGLGKALIGGAALIAAITGVNKMQADSMMKTEPQLVKLAQMRQQAEQQGDEYKVQELDDRIQQTMDHIRVTGRPVMGDDGKPVVPGEPVGEAKYQGRSVPLNKPMQGDVKKSKVYVKKGDKVVKVNFGDKNMKIKKSNPERRKSFRARHNCDNPGPKWKARYWSCRAW